jgi:hypothetical protein
VNTLKLHSRLDEHDRQISEIRNAADRVANGLDTFRSDMMAELRATREDIRAIYAAVLNDSPVSPRIPLPPPVPSSARKSEGPIAKTVDRLAPYIVIGVALAVVSLVVAFAQSCGSHVQAPTLPIPSAIGLRH